MEVWRYGSGGAKVGCFWTIEGVRGDVEGCEEWVVEEEEG